MKFCIDIMPHKFLSDPDGYLTLWKNSGVDSVQLEVAAENWRASLDDTAKARELLTAAGFEAALIAVPVGHPADPNDPHKGTRLSPGWRIRTGRDGRPEYNSAELTDNMISDVLDYARSYSSLGFDTFFMDDDLRSGNLSPLVCGCFCPDCLKAFSESEGKTFTRESLLASDVETLEKWCVFQSRRVTKLMRGLGEIVKKPGIMIMNSGDERHGISPRDLTAIPGIQIRIGEEHFFDEPASSLWGRIENFAAVTGHLFRIGGGVETYSETTVLNTRAYGLTPTTPAHTLSKAYLALTAGVDHIDWMCDKHYDMMAAHYRELRAYADETRGVRAYPVHVARDSFAAGTSYYPDLTATAAGLPAAPVFASEADGGQCLVLPAHLRTVHAWREAAERYTFVVTPDELPAIRAKLDVPQVETVQPVCLSWIPSRGRAALYNPLETSQTVSVSGKTVTLTAGGAAVVTL